MKVVIYFLFAFMLLSLICCQDIITTIAGSGGTGSTSGSYSGDGGAATSATLNYPYGVALDASGRILHYCLLHRYTVSSAMFDEIFYLFILIFPCPI